MTALPNPLLLCVLLATASAALADSAAPRVRIGQTGTITTTLPAGTHAVPVTDDADVVVSLTRPGAGAEATVSYVPTRAGTFDLRDYLRSADGSPVRPDGPLSVSAFSALPPGDDLTLTPLPPSPSPRVGGYRSLAVAVVSGWALLLIPLIFYKRPSRVRPAAPPLPAVTAVPVETQLQRLVRDLRCVAPTVAQKTRLETLLLAVWRDRLNLNALPMVDALRAMRRTPEAGRAIEGLECHLHAPHRTGGDLHALLDTCAPVAPAEGRA